MPPLIIFIFGLLAAGFALIVELLFSSVFLLPLRGFFSLWFFVFIEETCKLFFLKQYIIRFAHSTSLPSFFRLLLLGGLFGVGFSCTEILTITMTTHFPSLLNLTGIFLVHMTTGFSLFFAISRFPRPFVFFTLFTAILLHGLYNSFLIFL